MSERERPRILLIEDEPAIADAVVYALSTDGFEVIWCATGEEGAQAFKRAVPQLLILDIGLPDSNGFELFRRLRQIAFTPVIFLTARDEEIDRVAGLEMGADDYISKPFSPRELCARVRAVLRRGSAQEEILPAGENAQDNTVFSVNEAHRVISYYGQALDLSRYEYRLLKVLLQHPGRVYSREQLMQLAWNDPEHSLDRTIDTHIKTLRAKLREVRAGGNPIRTHRGVGYSLELQS